MYCNDITEQLAYNTYSSMPNMGYKIIEYLMKDDEQIWKLLKYNTPDALSKPNLTQVEKGKMIYKGVGDGSEYNVFRSAFLDDAIDKEMSQLRIYVTELSPDNRSWGTVNIAFECVVHNKITVLDNYQNRLELMVYHIIQNLNGKEIDGVGKLSFDKKMSFFNLARINIYNNRNFFGFTIIMSVKSGDMNE